ncbi:hypothetical protein KIPB_006919 [Kipferlia bialata]|uniref:Uncharacterized protein n=1 Tax=Kipferlia bialata TaxID=797122 RepID=A0A9K3CZA2_9EUKA|nr:hypothetical protein KIPB_006919 [Kipferlia bialata]|eukprot:g6919.t1
MTQEEYTAKKEKAFIELDRRNRVACRELASIIPRERANMEELKECRRIDERKHRERGSSVGGDDDSARYLLCVVV